MVKNKLTKNKIGRPPDYETPEEIKVIIKKYFKDCKKDKEPLTITGLALALWFNSRQSLLNYQGKPAFMDTIKGAKLKVENRTEKALYSKKIPTVGAIFNLKNNYWRKDKQEITGEDGWPLIIKRKE